MYIYEHTNICALSVYIWRILFVPVLFHPMYRMEFGEILMEKKKGGRKRIIISR